jgi:hypothetical protein
LHGVHLLYPPIKSALGYRDRIPLLSQWADPFFLIFLP